MVKGVAEGEHLPIDRGEGHWARITNRRLNGARAIDLRQSWGKDHSHWLTIGEGRSLTCDEGRGSRVTYLGRGLLAGDRQER